MSWFKDNGPIWKRIIDTIASEIRKTPIMVEKDIIQSIFLHRLSKTDLGFVFKGGTSLSKAYCLIERFSEDIDLSLSHKPTSKEKKECKTTIISIANELGLILFNEEKIFSRYNYNRYVYKYKSLFTTNMLEIIVETSFYQIAYPTCVHNITNCVNDFCLKNKVILPISFEERFFAMNVQTLERTFIDKVFAVCDYYIENKDERNSRHLYDIAKMHPFIVFDNNFRKLVIQVREDRNQHGKSPSSNSKYDINVLLSKIIADSFFENDFNRITTKLLYENISYKDVINKGIKLIIQDNVF